MAGVSMKDIKLRIRSMESTKQITRAMEMVAASKLRRAQDRVLQSRPYFEVLYQAVTEIGMSNREFSSPYVRSREGDALYIVIAGDRGLAGGYNHNILKLAEAEMAGARAVVLPIGKKALEHFRARGSAVLTGAYAEAAGLSISDCFTMARSVCRGFFGRAVRRGAPGLYKFCFHPGADALCPAAAAAARAGAAGRAEGPWPADTV